MRLSVKPATVVIMQLDQHCSNDQAEMRESRALGDGGFTLVELITIMVIVGILAVAAMPRFFDRSTFDSRGFYDQTISTLRYAQKIAVAQHRYVCVAFSANSITLSYGATAACGINLTGPAGQTPYTVTAPGGVTLSGGTPFYFNALGSASTAQSITVSGNASPITVEAATGYVH